MNFMVNGIILLSLKSNLYFITGPKRGNFTKVVELIEAELPRRQKQEKEALDCACVMKTITQHPKSSKIELLILMARK
jgi:hypothetical protein